MHHPKLLRWLLAPGLRPLQRPSFQDDAEMTPGQTPKGRMQAQWGPPSQDPGAPRPCPGACLSLGASQGRPTAAQLPPPSTKRRPPCSTPAAPKDLQNQSLFSSGQRGELNLDTCQGQPAPVFSFQTMPPLPARTRVSLFPSTIFPGQNLLFQPHSLRSRFCGLLEISDLNGENFSRSHFRNLPLSGR